MNAVPVVEACADCGAPLDLDPAGVRVPDAGPAAWHELRDRVPRRG